MKNIVSNIKAKALMAKEALMNAFQDIRENGLPEGLRLGVSNIDDLFRLDRGMVATITGIPNMGKSEFVDFIVVQLNKLYGMKSLFFSPENQPIGLHLTKLFRKLFGSLPDKVDSKVFEAASNYIFNNFFFFNYENIYSADDILKVAENAWQELGIDVLVIDSYNKMASDITSFETQLIGNVMDKLVHFAKRTGVIVLLVVHPKKAEKGGDGTYKMPKGYDMNGSANFLNKCDYSIIVHRNYTPNYAIIGCDKVKFSNYGGIGITALGYDNISTNYYDIDDTDLHTLHGIDYVAPAPAFIPFQIPEFQTEEA